MLNDKIQQCVLIFYLYKLTVNCTELYRESYFYKARLNLFSCMHAILYARPSPHNWGRWNCLCNFYTHIHTHTRLQGQITPWKKCGAVTCWHIEDRPLWVWTYNLSVTFSNYWLPQCRQSLSLESTLNVCLAAGNYCQHFLVHLFVFLQLQLQKTQYLQLGQNRGQYYGGSLPNVNQLGNNSIDLPFQVRRALIHTKFNRGMYTGYV